MIAPQVLQAIPNAIGALCLNEIGQTQLAHRPSIIPGLLSVFTSERHLKVLLDKENAVLIGTAIDELIRHHPSLKIAVFDALKSTISKIEELGNTYKVPKDLQPWYRLIPAVPNVLDPGHDVSMEDVESGPAARTPVDPAHIQPPNTEDEEETDSNTHDNYIVSFIDVLGRVRWASITCTHYLTLFTCRTEF